MCSGRSTAATSWADVSGNLPDAPVNSLILDPSFPNTLYAGTDVGAFVTYNGGATLDGARHGLPARRDLAARPRPVAPRPRSRHARPRGVLVADPATALPRSSLSKVDAGKPVGASSNVNYTITLKNIGNAAATDVHDHRSGSCEHELRLGAGRRDVHRRAR